MLSWIINNLFHRSKTQGKATPPPEKDHRIVSGFRSVQRRVAFTSLVRPQDALTTFGRRRLACLSTHSKGMTPVVHGKMELDLHADTIVAGANCCIVHKTGRTCEVSPHREDYDSITNVPIVQAATAWQSPDSGQVFILTFNEALWMGNSMSHSLVNPNQLRHCGIKVQDDPTSDRPLHMMTEDASFSLPVKMEGTTTFADAHTPSAQELQTCPHIVLSSHGEWDPSTVRFSQSSRSMEEEVLCV